MPRPYRSAFHHCLLLSALAACDQPDVPVITTCELERPVPDDWQRPLDLLFVVDTTPSMANLESAMSLSIQQFAAVLETLEGGTPDLHIAVVSSDLGAGGLDLAGCSGDGDGGRFLAEPQVPGCSLPADGFLRDDRVPWFQCADPAGCRERNFEGTLAEALQCMIPVGGGSCAVAQPLEAMKRALDDSNPGNAGFLREDSYLAVVFLTDGDDCSALDPSFFEPDPATGTWTDFRCHEHAVACSGQPLDGSAGTFTGCEPRQDGALAPLSAYVDFLASFDRPAHRVILGGVVAPPDQDTVTVTIAADGQPVLEPACDDGTRRAQPAVRLASLLQQFPYRHSITSPCSSAGYAEALLPVAEAYRPIPSETCLIGVAAEDTVPAAPGLQVACTVADVSWTMGQAETAVPPCVMADSETPHPDTPLPCFWAYENDWGDPLCPVSLRVERARAADPGTLASARCEIACAAP